MASLDAQTSSSGSSSHEQNCNVNTNVPAAIFDDGDSSNEDLDGYGDKEFSDVDLSDLEPDSDALSDSDAASTSSSDSDAATASKSLPWSKNLHHVHPTGFSGPCPGATIKLSPDKRAVDYFFLFFPAFLIQLLVLETNRYAMQRTASSKDKKWTLVTYPEMQAFLGMRVAMSILYLPRVHSYWCKDDLFGNLALADIMPRERFERISHFLHAADSSTNPPPDTDGHDELHHVRTILDTVNSNCRNLYHPHRNINVDEAMLNHDCGQRYSFQKFSPNKNAHYGFKVWMRADPTNGYCNEFKIYTGSNKDKWRRDDFGLGGRVVLDLTKDLRYFSYIVNVDCTFTSVALFEELKKSGILARGTVGAYQKGLPMNLLTPASKQPSDAITIQRGDMTAYNWPDKKDVILLSTADDPLEYTSVLRKQRSGEKKKYQCPSAISNYSENVNGVDQCDPSRSELSTARKKGCWWRTLFWFAFDLAIANALVLLKESGNTMKTNSGKMKLAKEVDMEDFRRVLASELIDGYDYQSVSWWEEPS